MRLTGLLIAAAILGGGFFFGQKLQRDAGEQNRADARARAERASVEATAALQRKLDGWEVNAQGAASNSALQAIVRGAGVDEATLQDWLVREEAAAPYRERAGAATVYANARRLGGSPSMLSEQELRETAEAAQREGHTARFLAHQGVYLVAAARFPFDGAQGEKLTVVLSRPMGQDEIDGLAELPLLITDQDTRLAKRGTIDSEAALIGKQAEGAVSVGAHLAVSRPVGKLWLWVLAPVEARIAPALPIAGVWGGAGLLALLVAVASFVLGGRNPATPRTETLPMQPIVVPGSQPPTPSQLGAGLEQTTASQQPNRYEEVAPLGEGGMARVSVAVTRGAEGFRRMFVVKRLKPELTYNPEIVAQFVDEARLGASLVHSNVVPVFDFGRDAMGYYIAQEYILGRDLDAVRRALFEQHRATLDLPLVLYVAQEALKALSYAHAKTDDQGRWLQLVHRDVSPNNLMVSARGELKLLDFGIVKAEGKLSHTQTGMIKGNVFYMSPEQARGLPVDARADLFSLGLVLYSLAAGEPLYRGNSNYELLTRAGAGLGDEEWARVARLPKLLAQLLNRVLQFEPQQRFASAEEFAGAIPPAQVGSANAMQQLIEALFRKEFAEERARFSGTQAPNARVTR